MFDTPSMTRTMYKNLIEYYHSENVDPFQLPDSIKQHFNILAVDDEPMILQQLKFYLEDTKYNLDTADSIVKAKQKFAEKIPDMLLLDIMMPEEGKKTDFPGIELCRYFKLTYPEAISVPVIFITGLAEQYSVAALKNGGTDYITKPFLYDEVIARIDSHAQKKVLLSFAIQKGLIDQLTGFFNHGTIFYITAKLVAQLQPHQKFSIIILDLDHFKKVNDTYGHPAGDTVLCTVSETISELIAPKNYVGRYGGEEFMIVLPDQDLNNALATAETLRAVIEALAWPYDGMKITSSFGVASWQPGMDTHQLVRDADQGLYISKNNGRNRVSHKQLLNKSL
jgi:diguanylate cyclase (GGDEF)-like protein